jgi:high-affinity nickel permease
MRTTLPRSPNTMQIVSNSGSQVGWGLVLAIVFIVIGVGNLVTLYTLARYFRRRAQDRQRHSEKAVGRDRDQGDGRR